MLHADDIVIMLIFFILAIIIPGFLTIVNCINLYGKREWKPKRALLLTLGIGFFEYVCLFYLTWEVAGDYNEVINTAQVHNALYSKNALSFWLPCMLGVLGLMILGFIPVKKTPPLVSAFSIAAVVIGNVMNIMFAVQIWENSDTVLPHVFFYLFHLNIILLSIYWIRHGIIRQVELIKKRETGFRYKWIDKLYVFLEKTSHMCCFSFVMIFPLALIIWLILIIFGQGADGVIKVFTMTADWTFSTQIPPPPVEYQGHYLCTIAAGGHKAVVKPIRLGSRRGHTIIVNRQLCIANAFEELIQERMPHFHNKVRRAYDIYGYPLSKKITTPLRADIIYIMMKPLEWIFLIVLYMFDANPESRIAGQYIYEKNHNEI